MNAARFREIAARYASLRVAVIGDFCLDRYLEIDPARAETSIETGLPVHNVTRVRAQPGAAGTVLNNLVTLGVGRIDVVGFRGEDGEGYELHRSLAELPGVQLDRFLATPDRRTFTYCKPLVMESEGPPRELNRLDSKNWTPTPPHVVAQLVGSVRQLSREVDAAVVMDQVDQTDTGVVTRDVLEALKACPPGVPVLADSRRGLAGYPPVIFKMNAAELAALTGRPELSETDQIAAAAATLAQINEREVIVTLSERGILGATPEGDTHRVPALPVRGPIDVVGAGDCVTANLAAALASQASVPEALEIASAAASVVLHQLGTTGTASVEEIEETLP